jgi:hypothetical protein
MSGVANLARWRLPQLFESKHKASAEEMLVDKARVAQATALN